MNRKLSSNPKNVFKQRIGTPLPSSRTSGTTGDFLSVTFFGDEGFRGVVILRAPSLDSALSLPYLLKLNPGGSVASAQLPSGLHEELL